MTTHLGVIPGSARSFVPARLGVGWFRWAGNTTKDTKSTKDSEYVSFDIVPPVSHVGIDQQLHRDACQFHGCLRALLPLVPFVSLVACGLIPSDCPSLSLAAGSG